MNTISSWGQDPPSTQEGLLTWKCWLLGIVLTASAPRELLLLHLLSSAGYSSHFWVFSFPVRWAAFLNSSCQCCLFPYWSSD